VDVDVQFSLPMCSTYFPIICTQEIIEVDGKKKLPEISGMIIIRDIKET
jgi:hypothetical protein